MDETLDLEDFNLEKLYDDPKVADGTVFYVDYFYHALHLRYALNQNQIMFDRLKEKGKKSTIRGNFSKLGLFYTLIFLTSQVVENLVKARSLYILYKEDKIKYYSTLKIVVKNYWKCNGHEILKIIKSSDIKITDEEIRLIKDIEPFFIWGGRFPHPYSRKEYVNNTLNNIQINYNSDCVKIIDGMFQRFAEEMKLSNHLHLPISDDN